MSAGFRDRADAGEHLAAALGEYADSDAVVVGMARGGVVLADIVSQALSLPLRALVVRKVGAPQNPELALGAVSETGVQWIDRRLVEITGTADEYLQLEIDRQVKEAQRRQREYDSGRALTFVRGRTAIVVDDGIATGASALVAVRSVRGLGASRVLLAAPAASQPAITFLDREVDHLVALLTPDPFLAVGHYYERFGQVSDAEVVRLLRDRSGGGR